jgi:regulatory protein
MDPYEKYFLKAVHFLKYRPRSEKEVRDNLKKKNAPDDVIERIIVTLKEQRFLNDFEFARLWVRQRIELKPKSKRIITLELQKKGIEKEIIEQVLDDPGEEKQVNDTDQAEKLVEQKLRRYQSLPYYEKRQKLAAFLGRRGFDWDTIKQVLQKHLKE